MRFLSKNCAATLCCSSSGDGGDGFVPSKEIIGFILMWLRIDLGAKMEEGKKVGAYAWTYLFGKFGWSLADGLWG